MCATPLFHPCRMDKKVWVKFENTRHIQITVGDGANVDDLIESVLRKVKVEIPPNLVIAKYDDKVLRSGEHVSEFGTSDGNPIVLCKGGMYSRSQKKVSIIVPF